MKLLVLLVSAYCIFGYYSEFTAGQAINMTVMRFELVISGL